MVGFFILERHYLLYQYSDYYIFLLPLFLYLYQAAEAMNNTPKNVNLLLDLGHLKVSSNILNFNKHKVHEESKQWIKAYHLSENNGFEDTNSKIKLNSWFINKLKKVDSYTLEVYTKNFNIMKNQIRILKKILKNN